MADQQKSRRSFIKNSATLTALAAAGPLVGLSPLDAIAAKQPADAMMHGIRIGAVSFVDEGVEKVLDIMEKFNRCAVLKSKIIPFHL